MTFDVFDFSRPLAALPALLLATACGVAEGPIYFNYAAPPNVAAQKEIGSAGGVIESPDGKVSAEVPAGALGKPVTLTIARVPEAPEGAFGPVYELGPADVQLAKPVHVSLTTDSAPAEGGGEMAATLAQLVDGSWRPLGLSAFDASTSRVTGSAAEVGTYAVVRVPVDHAPCRSGSKASQGCCAGACSRCLTECCEAAADQNASARITLDTISPPICQCSSPDWLSCAEACAADEPARGGRGCGDTPDGEGGGRSEP